MSVVVEFIASDKKNLLLWRPQTGVCDLPGRSVEFTQTFARAVELGSLTPAEPRSVYPSFVITEAWQSMGALSLAAGLFLNIGFDRRISLLIPLFSQIALGFRPDGRWMRPLPSNLFILPLGQHLPGPGGWWPDYIFIGGKATGTIMIIWAPAR